MSEQQVRDRLYGEQTETVRRLDGGARPLADTPEAAQAPSERTRSIDAAA